MSDRSHRDCNANTLFPFRNVSVQPRWANRSHRVCLTNSLFDYYQNRSNRVCVIGHTEITLCPNPNDIGPTELTCRSHYEPSRSDRVLWIGPTEFGDLCVTVRCCVEAIYTPPPTLHSWRGHQNMPTLPIHIFWERTTYTCVEVKIFHSNHINLDL